MYQYTVLVSDPKEHPDMPNLYTFSFTSESGPEVDAQVTSDAVKRVEFFGFTFDDIEHIWLDPLD